MKKTKRKKMQKNMFKSRGRKASVTEVKEIAEQSMKPYKEKHKFEGKKIKL